MMTQLIFSLALASALLVPSGLMAHEGSKPHQHAVAQTTETSTPTKRQSVRDELKAEKEARIKALQTAKAEKGERQLASSKILAERLIAERLKAIERLRSAGQTKHCRTAAKAEVSAALDVVVARLTATKASISSLTTVDAVRAIIKDDIVGKNHVFVALLPAVRGMCIADKLIALIDSKLIPAADKLKNEGKDTTKLMTELTSAKSAAQTAYDLYKKIATDPGSSDKTNKDAAQAALKQAKTHLVAARVELGSIKKADTATSTAPSTEDSESPSDLNPAR